MLCLLYHAVPAVQTWRNWDLNRMTMHELYAQFGLDVQTIDFVGHALALHQNDAYMMQVGGGWAGQRLGGRVNAACAGEGRCGLGDSLGWVGGRALLCPACEGGIRFSDAISPHAPPLSRVLCCCSLRWGLCRRSSSTTTA